MRIPVNLASDPFRRDRPFMVAAMAACAALSVLLIVLLASIITGRGRAESDRATVQKLTTQLKTLNAEQAKFDGTLRRPENAEVLERSLLLNTLIARKGISWTRIFSDLEKVMPYNVRLISIRLPQIDKDNQVTLDMIVGATSPEPVVQFLHKLEAAPQFGANSTTTFQPPSDNEPLWRYRVSVSYAQKL